MACFDDKAVNAWLRGDVPEDQREALRAHLDQCDACRDLVANVVQTQWIGQRLGRYRIVELVGGGAMGEVYRAEDPDLGRDVAIKIVRQGGSQQRLLREAQAMAKLAHPHVIRIYDVGTFDDTVFFAMELVQGSTLRTWFRERRPWQAVLAVMQKAGRGLHAAHQAGLVHGDFKPDNVLVADDGRVLVTDFGLARMRAGEAPAPPLLDTALAHTATRGITGTPAYMAPEQFEQAAATFVSDQFSFCVTLCEGLYGERPFPANDVESLRAAFASEPRLALRPRLPGRLVRALRRGLAVRPDARFASMAELLGELDAAASRRARWVVLGAAGVTAVAATAIWATMVRDPARCEDAASRLDGVWDPDARTRVTRAFAATKLPYAATSLASVTAILDRYRETWIAAHTETCRATHVRNEQSASLLDIRMQCLARRRQELDALADTLATASADVVRDAVEAANALPAIDACSHVASLQEVEQLPAGSPKRSRVVSIEADVARCRAQLAIGRYRPAYECASAAATVAHGIGHGPLVAEAELLAGMAAVRLRTYDDADAALRRALLAAETSRDSRARAQALIWLVAVAGERAAFASGHERAEHASAVIEGLGNDPVLASDLELHTGVMLLREGKLDASAAALGRAIAAREKLHGKNDARVAEPLVPLAIVHTMRRELDEATQLLDRAATIQREVLGDAHPAIGRTLHALAQVQLRSGKLDAALASQKRSEELLVAAYGERHRDVALSVGVAAQAYLMAGKYADAAPFARRSAELMELAGGAEHPDVAVALQTVAAVESRLGNTDAALAAHERALAIRMKSLGPDHLNTTQSQVSVAMSLRLKQRCDDALPLLHAALEARTKLFGPEHHDVLRVHLTLGDCNQDLGNTSAAAVHLERAVAGLEKLPLRTADDRVTLAQARYGLARVLWETPSARARATELARTAHAELSALKDKRADAIATWAKNRKVKLE